MSWKICTKCGTSKPSGDYYKAKKGQRAGKIIMPCKTCIKKKHKKWREGKGYEKHRENNRVQSWKAQGIKEMTIARYNEMYEAQEGRCAICGGDNGVMCIGKKHFCVDHDHKTGQIRGLLCSRCNWLVGLMEDWEFYSQAQFYLGEYRGVQHDSS